eukprot:5897704-Prymnesium_polylepis.1
MNMNMTCTCALHCKTPTATLLYGFNKEVTVVGTVAERPNRWWAACAAPVGMRETAQSRVSDEQWSIGTQVPTVSRPDCQSGPGPIGT